MSGNDKPPEQEDKPRWAGHGHVGAFILQLSVLILVNLALWGFIFLMALRLSGVAELGVG